MGEEFLTHEVSDPAQSLSLKLKESDKVIIATPTDTHLSVIQSVMRERVSHHIDILCEKPVVKSRQDFVRLANIKFFDHDLFVVNQYQYLPQVRQRTNLHGYTQYDYWNTGKDGLHWDCFQLFRLAQSMILLNNESPYWTCSVNGTQLKIEEMDGAYVSMLADFLTEKKLCWGLKDILETTEKIFQYEANALSAHRNPGPQHVN